MSRETKKHIKTIKDYIPIVVRTKKKKKRTYPKKKEIDIKNPKFRIKGLEKEKSKQIICPEKQKKEQEEGLQKKEQKNKKKEKSGKLENKKEVDLVAAILGK